jgi:hypothetical protein
MMTKTGVDGESAYIAHPFQFGGEESRAFPVCALDILI